METTSFFHWDPSPYMFEFSIPLLNRPILWYGFFFALGFFIAYRVILWVLPQQEGKRVAEKLAWYVILGTVIGARLGDVLFYQDWDVIRRDPISVVKVWEGGLASHGGALGILVALYLFSLKEGMFSFLEWVDRVALTAGCVGGLIRIGNFVNQELVGTPSTVPWAVVFGHPADGSSPVPRHPVQLYEAFAYFFFFFFMLFLWKKVPAIQKPGRATGLFVVLVFSFRFVIEFWKEEASRHLTSQAFLDMAQYLSLPFIVLGFFLLARKQKKTI